jgi:glycosyltransferase involved in cell wall biosynthesis
MKLLIVSHPSVTPINQQLFIEVERLTGWELTLLGPSNWIDDYGIVRGLRRRKGFQGRIVSTSVWPKSSIPLHTYKRTFISFLRSEKPDVIYIHNEPYAASTAQFLLYKTLSGVNSLFGFYSAQNIEKSYPPPFCWTEKWVYRRSSFAFPCSQTVLDTLRSKGYKQPATLLPLGLDPDVYHRRPEDAVLRSSLAGDADVLFGYVGRLTPEKGIATLLRALSVLPNELCWNLAIVGSGPQEGELRDLSENYGLTEHIEWLGFVDHARVPRYLSAFDALVVPSETQPSWKEQFGRVIVEALACETPVVGTNSGEIPHLLNQTEGGIIVEERNPEDLASGLLRLARDPRHRRALAARGSRYVRTHLDHGSLAEKFVSSIKSAITPHRQVNNYSIY